MTAAKAQVSKWGNSLAVRIPRSMADAAHFSEGDILTLEVEGDGVIAMKACVRPASLRDLLSQVTPENIHGVVDWGEPAGNEYW